MSSYGTYLEAINEQLDIFKRQQFVRNILPVVRQVKTSFQEKQKSFERYKAIQDDFKVLINAYVNDIKKFETLNDLIQTTCSKLSAFEIQVQRLQKLSNERPDETFIKSEEDNFISKAINLMKISDIDKYIKEIKDLINKEKADDLSQEIKEFQNRFGEFKHRPEWFFKKRTFEVFMLGGNFYIIHNTKFVDDLLKSGAKVVSKDEFIELLSYLYKNDAYFYENNLNMFNVVLNKNGNEIQFNNLCFLLVDIFEIAQKNKLTTLVFEEDSLAGKTDALDIFIDENSIVFAEKKMGFWEKMKLPISQARGLLKLEVNLDPNVNWHSKMDILKYEYYKF